MPRGSEGLSIWPGELSMTADTWRLVPPWWLQHPRVLVVELRTETLNGAEQYRSWKLQTRLDMDCELDR